MTNTEDTAWLETKVFDSILEWNIVKFNDYSKCDLESIASRKISIEGTDIYWILHVHPNGYHSSSSYDDSFVALSIQVNCENPLLHHCFKIEVRTVGAGHRLMESHHQHELVNFVESIPEYISPSEKLEPIIWNIDYENIKKRQHFELFNEYFIIGHDLAKYMFDGSLRLIAKVSTESMDVVEMEN